MDKVRRLRLQLTLAGAGVVVLLVVLFVFLGQYFSGPPPATEKTIRQVNIVRPPPPPPPKIEKPPEPEMEQEIEEPEPENEPEPLPDDLADQAPPGDELGLDADGVAGADAFGLVARRGGRGLLEGAGDRHRWFAGQVRRAVEDALLRHDELRHQEYAMVVHVWVGSSGEFVRTEVVRGGSEADLEELVATVLAGVPGLSERPPEDLPQPIKLRIRARL